MNTRARSVHDGAGDARRDRHGKADMSASLHAGQRNGLDHTPPFRFLLPRMGQDRDQVRSDAAARRTGSEPINRMVARSELDARP